MQRQLKNVVLIVIDSLRYDEFLKVAEFQDDNFFKQLISDGCIYHGVFSVNSSTVPCFASILSGSYPFEHGVFSQLGPRIRDNAILLQKVLSEHGWYTHAEVTGPNWPDLGYLDGFEYFNRREPDRTIGISGDNIYTQWWYDFLERLKNMRKPYFVLLHLWELHFPIVTPPGVSQNNSDSRYTQALVGLSKKLKELMEVLSGDTYIILTGDHGERVSHRGKSMGYFVRSTYRWLKLKLPLKKVMRKLHRFTSLGLQVMYKKRILDPHSLGMGHGYHVFDYLSHVPLVISPAPSGVEVREDFALRSQIDIAPTILELLGIKGPRFGEFSRSMLSAKGHPYVFIEANVGNDFDPERFICSIRTEKLKYVSQPYSQNPFEVLYDLSIDPDEKKPVQNPESYEEYAELKDILNDLYLRKHNRVKEWAQERVKVSKDEEEKRREMLKELGYF